MGDDPPYLTVGTEVSAKYKGAFCEAKIRKVVRSVKCKVTFKAGLGSLLLSEDLVKGTLRVGAVVEAKHSEKNQFVEAVINKIQDCSQYTVVFDDGDITTLRRSALCLKSGRHFNETDTLDHLPLTHPEHFSNPVVGTGRRGVRRRFPNAERDESSDEEESTSSKKGKKREYGDDIGKVVCVESNEKKKAKDNWFPALVVSPSAQEPAKNLTKDECLVRSFRDGRFYTVPKKEITDFTKEFAAKSEANTNIQRAAVEKALTYLEKKELPAHWDKEALFGKPVEETESEEEQSESEDVSEGDWREEKDHFVAQLYKFMDDRGTPINKAPTVCNKDLDLYKLYKIVTTNGGYNKVSNSNEWKKITVKMGYGNMPSTSTINLVKQAYKKFLQNFEDFYRKLGCTMHSKGTSGKSRVSRSLYRERQPSGQVTPKETATKPEPSTSKKEETAVVKEKEEKPPVSEPEVESTASDSEAKADEPRRSRSRQEMRGKKEEETKEPTKESPQGKKRKEAAKEKEPPVKEKEKEKEDSPKKVGRGKGKKKVEEEPEKPKVEPPEITLDHIGPKVKISIGDKLLVYYGPISEGKVKYEAKVLELNDKVGSFFVHYTGWNNRYDEWIKRDRVCENLSLRLEKTKSPAQGRGPAIFKDKDDTTPKKGAKKGRPSLVTTPVHPSPPGLGTRSKSGALTARKRLSSEGEISVSIKKRRTRQKSGMSEGASSDSEGKGSLSVNVSTPPSSVGSVSSRKKKEEDDASSVSSSTSETKGPKVLPVPKEETKRIDLNEIRSEMKGLDKILKSSKAEEEMAKSEIKIDVTKSSSPPPQASPTSMLQGTAKLDVYEFEEESEAPKLKIFGPRSPEKKDEVVTPVKVEKEVTKPEKVAAKILGRPVKGQKELNLSGSPPVLSPPQKPTPSGKDFDPKVRLVVPVRMTMARQRAATVSTSLPPPPLISSATPLNVMQPGGLPKILPRQGLNVPMPSLIQRPIGGTIVTQTTPVRPIVAQYVKPGSKVAIGQTEGKKTAGQLGQIGGKTEKKIEPKAATLVDKVEETISLEVKKPETIQPKSEPPKSEPLPKGKGANKEAKDKLVIETQPKKKMRKVISKKFVDSETDSSSEAESEKKATRKKGEKIEVKQKKEPQKKLTKTAQPQQPIDVSKIKVGSLIVEPGPSTTPIFPTQGLKIVQHPIIPRPILPGAAPFAGTTVRVRGGSIGNLGEGFNRPPMGKMVGPRTLLLNIPPRVPPPTISPPEIQPKETHSLKIGEIPEQKETLTVMRPMKREHSPDVIMGVKSEGKKTPKKVKVGGKSPGNKKKVPEKKPVAEKKGKPVKKQLEEEMKEKASIIVEITKSVITEKMKEGESPKMSTVHKIEESPKEIEIKLDSSDFPQLVLAEKEEEKMVELKVDAKDESSHSLLCEEIIPGSPQPEVESETEKKDMGGKEDLAIRTEKKDTEDISKSQALEEKNKDEETNLKCQERVEEMKEDLGEESSDHAPTALKQDFDPIKKLTMEEKTPPLTPETSSHSSDSPRIEHGRISPPIGGGSSKSSKSKDSSDGESGDREQIKPKRNLSERGRRRMGSKRGRGGMDGKPYLSPPPKRRRIQRRNKSPDEVSLRPYPYRGRLTTRKVTENHEHGRFSAPQPPVNLIRPPKHPKYNFIPDLDHIEDPEERVAKILDSINDLRETHAKIKQEYLLFERKRKRRRKRDREREKEKLAQKNATIPTD